MNSIPNDMNYIHCDQPGGPEVMRVTRGPVPKPAAGEVLIRTEGIGVNRPDIVGRKGLYPPPPGASDVLGLEVAGRVVSLGAGVTQWKVDDAVCALVTGGGYAEYCVAPAEVCLPVPKSLSMIEAAGVPETFFTVWSNVFMRAQLRAGETFLVHGGTSGIGTTAIQLAHANGARVFATAGSDDKCRACVALGADAAINYKTQDFVHEIKTLTHGRGVNLILDMVGGNYFTKNLDCLTMDGRLAQIAYMQGQEVSLNLSTLMNKRITVTGARLRPRPVNEKAEIARELKSRVWPLLESGAVRVPIAETFPLERVADAHRLMESSQHIGKIILTIA